MGWERFHWEMFRLKFPTPDVLIANFNILPEENVSCSEVFFLPTFLLEFSVVLFLNINVISNVSTKISYKIIETLKNYTNYYTLKGSSCNVDCKCKIIWTWINLMRNVWVLLISDIILTFGCRVEGKSQQFLTFLRFRGPFKSIL